MAPGAVSEVRLHGSLATDQKRLLAPKNGLGSCDSEYSPFGEFCLEYEIIEPQHEISNNLTF